MNQLGNFISGKWITGEGDGQVLYDAIDGTPVATASTKGIDFASV